MTAKRSWPTSAVRRVAASTDNPPMVSRPINGRATATPMGTSPSRSTLSGHTTIEPSQVVGAVGAYPVASPRAHSTSAQPIPRGTQRDVSRDEVRSPAPIASAASVAPKSAPHANHGSDAPPSRWSNRPAPKPVRIAPPRQA